MLRTAIEWPNSTDLLGTGELKEQMEISVKKNVRSVL